MVSQKVSLLGFLAVLAWLASAVLAQAQTFIYGSVGTLPAPKSAVQSCYVDPATGRTVCPPTTTYANQGSCYIDPATGQRVCPPARAAVSRPANCNCGPGCYCDPVNGQCVCPSSRSGGYYQSRPVYYSQPVRVLQPTVTRSYGVGSGQLPLYYNGLPVLQRDGTLPPPLR